MYEARKFALRWAATDLQEHLDSADGLNFELDEQLGEKNAQRVRDEMQKIISKMLMGAS